MAGARCRRACLTARGTRCYHVESMEGSQLADLVPLPARRRPGGISPVRSQHASAACAIFFPEASLTTSPLGEGDRPYALTTHCPHLDRRPE